MSYQEASGAMGYQDRQNRTGLHSNIQPANPIVTDRTIPMTQFHTLTIEMAQAPDGLPMVWPRITEAGQDEHRRCHGVTRMKRA